MFQFIDDLQNVSAAQRAAVQRVMILRIVGKDSGKTLEFLRAKFAEYDPLHPFEFAFLDESNDRLYISEKRLMKIPGFFGHLHLISARSFGWLPLQRTTHRRSASAKY
jgi:hypothetical protein